jgi:hypothetical protein
MTCRQPRRPVGKGLFLDRHAVWASNLFDMKEHFAAIGLPLVGGLVLSRVMDPAQDRALRRSYLVMVGLVAFIAWFNVIAGLLITMARSV